MVSDKRNLQPDLVVVVYGVDVVKQQQRWDNVSGRR
jgi:hypothetical protein